MIGSRAYRRSERNVVAGLEQILVTVRPANPLVVAWRWRYELGLALVTGLPAWWLVERVGGALTLAVAAALAAAAGLGLAMSPAARKLAARRAWCVITAHRVRVGCAQARIHSRGGRLPFVLVTRAQPDGERVLLWCRAGTSIEDFAAARPLLVAACWASDLRVRPGGRYAQLVALDVVRRQPAVAPVPQLARPPIPRPRQPAD
jgi:hypothetical protein